MSEELVVSQTKRIAPRYYGLCFRGQDTQTGEVSTGVFDNPSTAALAIVAITSPNRDGGLIDQLGAWQKHKERELREEFGYSPVFTLTEKQRKALLDCTKDELVKEVRESIRTNHGSYNLFDQHGNEAVAKLTLRGENLSATVRSQKAGWHEVHLKGARENIEGLRYADCRCDCKDNAWMEEKAGKRILLRRNCLHIKEAEIEAYLERRPVREIKPLKGEPSLTFDFLREKALEHLVMDILIAHEVLGQNLYSIDRRLLSHARGEDGRLSHSLIPQAIMPLSLIKEVSTGKARFEILNQRRNTTQRIPRDILSAQETIFNAFERELYLGGYSWLGYGLELGQPGTFYSNGEHRVWLGVYEKDFGDKRDSANGLPFYVVRSLQSAQSPTPLTLDSGPQHPLAQPVAKQWRIDDRTRKSTLGYIRPASDILLPEVANVRVLRNQLPTSVVRRYQASIRENQRFPEGILREYHLK